MRNAYFAGGCFWCITPFFRMFDGVTNVRAGYSGGDEINPTYEQVKKQQTGHRETIRIEYDENKVAYDELLDVFISNIDPYDEGGQFIDRGRSYTLAVYYNDEYEKNLAEKMCSDFEEKYDKKVFIAVEKFKSFFEAEEYHQDYFLKNPEAFEKELIESGRKSE